MQSTPSPSIDRLMESKALSDAFSRSDRGDAYQTKTTYVLTRLRELIIGGALEPGTRVRQHEIAEALDVSITPVREAIRQLESEGYVESLPHVGAQVADFGRDNLEEVFELRALLEARLTRRAVPNLTQAQFDELRRLATHFRALVSENEPTQLRQTNYRFHRVIWEAARQPISLETVDRLWAKFPRNIISIVPGRALRSAVEHDQLLAALEARDADRAAAIVTDHILGGFEDARDAGIVGSSASN
jgi:DNA-binding GntR family transcriptional regulator